MADEDSLDGELFRDGRDECFALAMATTDVSLLFRGEMTSNPGHGKSSLSGLCYSQRKIPAFLQGQDTST